MKGYPGSMAQLVKQANQMQNKMKKVQEELAEKTYEGSAGGGGVKIVANGKNQLVSVAIQAELIKPEDLEMLQDLILLAANDALKVAKETSDKEMEKITGGFNMPGMF